MRSGRIPAPLTSFVGRDPEVATLLGHLARGRLITLLGPGGVGKTRLASEVARAAAADFRDGAWIVPLAEVGEAADVAEAVASALSLKFSSAQLLELLTEAVADRDLLLVLDNCEHVLPGCQVLADRLLRAAPGLRIVATSQQALRMTGEEVVEVRPLGVPDAGAPLRLDEALCYPAIRLLDERASAVSAHYRLTEDELDVTAEICRRLDGLPLAIELAAARLRSLSPSELLARLDDRFALLACGDPTALPRHRTLHALVGWSHDLCSPDERSLWSQLAVFAGGADVEAIEAVCSLPGDRAGAVLDALAGLVDKSIVTTERHQPGLRYRMLESISRFGRERLEESGERQSVLRRHREHYRRLASEVGEGFWGADQQRQLARLAAEHRNLGAAFDALVTSPTAADRRAALTLASDLRILWVMGGYLQEGRRRLELALSAAPGPGPERATALWSCAWVALLHGDLAAAEAHLAECAAMPDTGSAGSGHFCATWRGTVALFTGNLAAATDRFMAAAEGHRNAGSVEGHLMTLFQLAITRSLSGDHDGAGRACDDAVRLSAERGETWARSYALWAAAHDALARGREGAAARLAGESLDLKAALDDRMGTALVVEVLAAAVVDSGRPEDGARLLGAADALWRAIGTALAAFGPQLTAVRTGVVERARRLLGDAAFERALDDGRRLGPVAARDHARAAARAAARSTAPADDGRAGPVHLTRREQEVAALVGQGMSNREIAAELVLSHRTIEGHVEHVLAKLGFRSRAEIAVWAVGRGRRPQPGNPRGAPAWFPPRQDVSGATEFSSSDIPHDSTRR